MRRQIAPLSLLAVLLAAAVGPARAQDTRPFCAERPGKATPPCIVEAGRAQAEVGLADAAFQGRERLTAFGAAELRFGLTPRAEAEVAWTALLLDHVKGVGTRSGVGDLTLGGRLALGDPEAEAQASLQAFVTAPTATHGLGSGWAGGLRLPFALPLSGGLDFAATPEVDVVRDADGRGGHLAWSAVAAVSHAFGQLTLGAELWGLLDRDPAGHRRQASFDLTAARAVGADAQLDAGVNLGLTHATPDAEVYVGVARRF